MKFKLKSFDMNFKSPPKPQFNNFMCVFGLTVGKIDFDRIEFERIDFG
jgi:hypothetical protein